MSRSCKSRSVLVEPTADDANAAVADLLKTIVCEAVSARGACHLALVGGTTPHGLYRILADEGGADNVPWQQVQVFFGDERCVPLDHVESNYLMAQRALLDHVPVPPHHVHPMRADADDVEAAAAEYETTIRQIVPAEDDGVPRFDLILLGMGGDGHTVSLFPHTDALSESEKLVLTYLVPVLGRHRMTLTLPLINAARNLVMLVTGDDKADVVATILGGDVEATQALPAAHVCPAEGKLVIVLDEPAARQTDLKC
jgi:6-phosphogluconolactonase